MARAISSCGSGRQPVAAFERLYDERARRALTQVQAAQLCGVHQQTFSGWEQVKHRPRRPSLAKLSDFLNLSQQDLVRELERLFPFVI